MRLLPKNFPYPQKSTLGMAQASAYLAKKSLNLEKLPLRDLFKPEVQVMACAYLQAKAAKEYDANPSLAENKLLYIVCRYTGTGLHATHNVNIGVFADIMREGEEKSQNGDETH